MKYPEELVEKYIGSGVVSDNVQIICEYAKWARGQLEPRQSHFPIAGRRRLLCWDQSKEVWEPKYHILKGDWYIPMPPPPEEPDPFKEWVSRQGGMTVCCEFEYKKCWDAAIASVKGEKK
jgi:hypothetical protein